MNKIASGALALFVTTSLGLVFACGSSTSGTCDETATCPPAGGDGGGSDVTVPEGCDPSGDPKDAPKCVVNDFGVFVDGTNGNDANPGTRESPLKTINGALAKTNGKPRVYICEGTYEEHVKLTIPVSLYGGFACGSWTPSGLKAKVAPKDEGYALELDDVKDVTISAVDFDATPGSSPARSSISVFARSAKALLTGLSITASDGFDGAAGGTGSNYDASLLPDDAKLAGRSANGTTAGAEQTCAMLCTNGEHSTGGKGGAGGATPSAGDPGKPDRGAGFGGAANAGCVSVGAGGTGGAGNPGATGADAIAGIAPGKLTSDGWQPTDGTAGAAGTPGQGGGGGGGATSGSNGAGGGGGCGGCGGAAGTAAQGGGGSIALLSFNSTLKLTKVLLSSGKAGNGGAGASGQTGQVGGFGGTQTLGGCQAGAGGKGGTGGASAGGAGGVAAGIVYKGDKPTMDAVSATLGAAGTKGAGGASFNAGPDGVKAEALEVQ